MSLEIIINADIKQSMLNRDKKKLEALRAIKASLLLAKTGKDATAGEVSEEVEISILRRLVKQRKESAEIYNEKGREEMASEELYQAGVIENYLPVQMGAEQVEIIVKEAIQQLGANSMKDMGKVMGLVKPQIVGRADMGEVSGRIKSQLATN